jgi:hypothetical protein
MNCDHGPCTCSDASINQNGKHYCSTQCAQSAEAGSPANTCSCAHDDCQGRG